MPEVTRDEVKDILSNDKANEALRKARREAKNLRDRLQAVEQERDRYKADHAKLDAEFKGFNESSLKKELDDLKAGISKQKHMTALETVAKKLKVRSEALMDLEKIVSLNAEGEPDEKAIETSLKEALKSRPYLIEPESPMKSGPGLDRGDVGLPGEFVVKSSNMRDMKWMQANQAKIAKAQKDGTFKLFEDLLPKGSN